MARGTCAACGREVDTRLAPHVAVVGGRVLSFCSAACRGGRAATEPAVNRVDEVGEVGAPAEVVSTTATVEPAAAPVVTEPAPMPVRALTPQENRTPAASPTSGLGRSVRTALTWRPTMKQALVAAAITAAVVVVVVILASRSQAAAPPPVAMIPVSSPPVLAPRVEIPERGDEARETITPEKLLAEAHHVLAEVSADPSPRLRLAALLALARVRDPLALAELATALEQESSEIRKLEIARALAQAGDAHAAAATEVLVAGLRSNRRDVRLEAARSLALLGDARGADRLREALDVAQLRLGAAEHLALLGDAQGFATLKDALAGKGDAAKSNEIRMRAAVALARAGDASGRELLGEMVADPRLDIGAEDALARLGDRSAVPALQRALGLSALRVQAAIDLRRLDTVGGGGHGRPRRRARRGAT